MSYSFSVCGRIRTVIGQAQLLMDQRFKQFEELITLHQVKNNSLILKKESESNDSLIRFTEFLNVSYSDRSSNATQSKPIAVGAAGGTGGTYLTRFWSKQRIVVFIFRKCLFSLWRKCP